MHMISPKPDSFYHSEHKMALGYQNPFYLKQAQQKQQSLYNGKVLLEKHDPPVVYDSEETLQLAQETDKSLAKHKALELEIKRLLRAVISQDIMSIVQNNSVVDTSNLQTELDQCQYDKISYDKAYNEIQQKIKRLQAQLGDLKGKCKDTSCVSDTLDPLPQKLENENNKLHDTIDENAKLRAQLFDKVSDQKDTSKVTSNLVPTTKESKVVDYDKVIAPRKFRIDPRQTSRKDNFVPNKPSKESVRTNPITVSQPHVIIKKAVNADSNGFSSTGVDITTKTRRQQPRSNTKNDRVPSASKSSRIMNKEVKVEDHPRNLLLSKNKKHMSSECNNIKFAIQNDKSKIVCAVWHKERLASPKPSKPRFCLRWSPTGRFFDIKGKIIASSESESQSDCSNGDNACTPNPQEPTIKRFPSSAFFLGRLSKYVYGTVRFGNDHVATILGFGDLQWGNILITRVYFIEGLGHNLFSVGQFCDSDLEEKSKRASHPPKPVPNSKKRLHLLHMDLCGPMRIASINGKRYVLVIVDDYSRYTWVVFLKSKDEAPKEIKNFLKRITVLLQASVIIAEAIVTACYTQNRSIIHRRFDKTPYELINGRKPDISFLHVFGTLCYPKNDREDIGKLGAKGDIGFFIGYSANSCAYRVYNQRTKKIMETMNVTFDELSAMAFEQSSLKPGLQSLTSGQISSGLDLPYASSTITTQQPTEGEMDLLFEAMYDDHIGGQSSATLRTIPSTQAPQVLQTPTATTTTADTALTPINLLSQATNISSSSQNVNELETQQQHGQHHPASIADNVPNATFDDNTFVNPFATPSTSAVESSSSQYVNPSNMHTFYQPYPHEYQWTKDYPLEQVIGEPS
ncbi:retrovirus-related pol polyprotein from transposon TNT 1-94 [Tanacetum coccineum]